MRVNLAELAEILSVSLPTLRKAVTSDTGFPVEQRGKNGKSWEFDAGPAVAYWFRQRGQARPSSTPAAKSPAERKAEADATMAEAKLKQMLGELIEREPMFLGLSGAYARLGAHLERLPNAIGRERDWAPDEIEALRERLDQMRRDFARDVREYQDPVEPATDQQDQGKEQEDDAVRS